MTTDHYQQPDGFQWGHFKNSKGADIRYGHVAAKGESRGALIVLPGFRESIEKYFEVAREMTAEGLDVWVMDWRGQGGSERYIKDHPQKAHHEGYDEQIDTLRQFVDTVVSGSGKPLLMMAHSMGAHLGLRYLKEHPGKVDAAMLTAPMLDVSTGALPKKLARQMTKFAKAGGYLDKYIPGAGDWDEKKHAFKDNFVTSDPARYEAAFDITRKNDSLKIGEATYGWVYHTFQSIDVLNKEEYLKSIATPILMQISGDDKIVERAAQDRAVKLLQSCRVVELPEARHEIWSERDVLRRQWLDKVKDFIGERLKLAGPSPKKPKRHTPPPAAFRP